MHAVGPSELFGRSYVALRVQSFLNAEQGSEFRTHWCTNKIFQNTLLKKKCVPKIYIEQTISTEPSTRLLSDTSSLQQLSLKNNYVCPRSCFQVIKLKPFVKLVPFFVSLQCLFTLKSWPQMHYQKIGIVCD